MLIQIPGETNLFCITLGSMMLISLFMTLQSRYFYTQDVVRKKFTMFDLQLAATAMEIVNIMKGIFLLPPDESKKTVHALKLQLYIDFLFMPALYSSIFLLCMKVSTKMGSPFGQYVFIILAFAQVIPWLCNIIENIYLFSKITPKPELSSPEVHKRYLYLELAKWSIALTGIVCSVFACFYFWLIGSYTLNALYYLIIILSEIAVFMVVGKLIASTKPKEETGD